jgi:hypothetical protein
MNTAETAQFIQNINNVGVLHRDICDAISEGCFIADCLQSQDLMQSAVDSLAALYSMIRTLNADKNLQATSNELSQGT